METVPTMMRRLGPLLAGVTLALAAACSGPLPVAMAPVPAPAPPTDAPEARLAQTSLDLVNAARRAEGLEPMRLDPLLSTTALAHARDMQARGFYAHNSPSGDGPQQRHDRAGGADWRLVAENIARCSRCTEPPTETDVRDYHARWMASAGHRANILSPGLDSFGFAAVHGPDGFFLVQNFAGPGMPNGWQPGEPLDPLSPDTQASEALARINAARNAAGAPPLQHSAALTRAILGAMPRPGDRNFDVASTGAVQQALPAAERARWGAVGTVYGACGGCGRAPVSADIRFFVAEWLERPGLRSLLLDPAATHLGFTVAANGTGRKVALAAVGRGV